MRERNYGFMFLTYNGQIVRQMHKDLTAPIYLALSLTNVTKDEAIDFDKNCILRNKEAPIGIMMIDLDKINHTDLSLILPQHKYPISIKLLACT
jgi:hypothetical protein